MDGPVFTSLNTRKRFLGVDFRLWIGCAAIAVTVTTFLDSLWSGWLVAAVCWVIGFVGERRDRRFLDFIPLELQLKTRYEAGRRERTLGTRNRF